MENFQRMKREMTMTTMKIVSEAEKQTISRSSNETHLKIKTKY